MREALARADHDDGVVTSRARRAPARRRKDEPSRAPLWGKLLGGLVARPGTTTLGLVGAGLLTAIVVNALVLQDKRHPAPLFQDFSAAPALRPQTKPVQAVAPAQTAPLPQARPVETAAVEPSRKPGDPIGQLLQGGNGDRTAAIRPREKSDSIGSLLKGEAHAAAAEPDRQVIAGQKALAKLGYGIKADGLAGSATRQAIEKFERSRRLPVTGEFSPRTMRELAALSGLPVD